MEKIDVDKVFSERKVSNAGFLENLKNAMFSNDLLAIKIGGGSTNYFLSVSQVQQEDGSANGFAVEGSLFTLDSNKPPVLKKVKAYLKYSDRSKPGTGTLTYI